MLRTLLCYQPSNIYTDVDVWRKTYLSMNLKVQLHKPETEKYIAIKNKKMEKFNYKWHGIITQTSTSNDNYAKEYLDELFADQDP